MFDLFCLVLNWLSLASWWKSRPETDWPLSPGCLAALMISICYRTADSTDLQTTTGTALSFFFVSKLATKVKYSARQDTSASFSLSRSLSLWAARTGADIDSHCLHYFASSLIVSVIGLFAGSLMHGLEAARFLLADTLANNRTCRSFICSCQFFWIDLLSSWWCSGETCSWLVSSHPSYYRRLWKSTDLLASWIGFDSRQGRTPIWHRSWEARATSPSWLSSFTYQ